MRIIEHESTLRCQYSNLSDSFVQRVEENALQLGVLGGSASPIEDSPWRKAMPKPFAEAARSTREVLAAQNRNTNVSLPAVYRKVF